MCDMIFRGNPYRGGEAVTSKTIVVIDEAVYLGTGAPVAANWDNEEGLTYLINGEGRPILVEVDPDTLRQYTSLNDKKDRKIFGGDLLRLPECVFPDGDKLKSVTGVVIWDNGGWQFAEEGTYLVDTLDESTAAQSEIIGNVWDDPELMEGQG